MHTQLDLELVTESIDRLEKEVDSRLSRIKNLKIIKQRIQAELGKEKA
jgi:hypothetical protein